MAFSVSARRVRDAHRQDPNLVVRGMRWLAAGVIGLQFLPGGMIAQPAGWGAFLVGALVFVNVASIAVHNAFPSRWRLIGWVELTVDTLLALCLLWLLRDGGAPAWALLALPVTEGALRGRLWGALGAWATTAAALSMLHLGGGAGGIPTLLLDLGLLGMVAMACGLLAESLGHEMESQRRAHGEAARRAQLLATVAAAARELSTLDAEQVLASIVDSAIDLGFDCAEMCVLTSSGQHWRSVHPRGLPHSYSGGIQPLGAGVAGLVYTSRSAVELEDYSSWEQALPALGSLGLRGVYAAPVWAGGDISGVLTAATRRPEPLTASEHEALELLASQASRALDNANRYAEREELRRQLTHQAFHDALTGLPNRALLRDRLVQALARARRDGSRIAVMFLDLDGFKLVNDRAGHHAGDELLVAVAARLELCVRPGDTVARFGGDEFTILLEGVAGVDNAVGAARRVLAALEEPVDLGEDHRVVVSASVGIATSGAGGDTDADRLLQQADRAMYLAKERGKGLIEVYDAQADRRHRDAIALDGQLRRSVAEGQLEVHYQPLVGAHDQTVQGVEALARWSHPERGPIPPSLFIPIAERSGTIIDLGRLVLSHAARTLAAPAGTGVRLCVNVSARELEHPAFIGELEASLQASGLEANRLLLELTEQAVIDDDNVHLRRTLAGLRRLEVQFAVDDFGRGFSSLRYLRDLPVDEVKLDRALVAGTLHTPEDRAIVRWTIELAHELGMRVTAEGVETMEQLRCLRDLGCDLVQGYLFAAPRPFAEVAPLLAAGVVRPDAVSDTSATRR